MIRSFACKETAGIWEGNRSRRFPGDIQKRALMKLLQLDAAESLDDLKLPPGNYLEPLKGKRKGQHSIRINSQWRVCFLWTGQDAEDVEIVDYH
jgi:proteic killer suppression protein